MAEDAILKHARRFRQGGEIGGPDVEAECGSRGDAKRNDGGAGREERPPMSAEGEKHGSRRPSCGLKARDPNSTPASTGRLARHRRPAPISAQVRNAFCPCVAFIITAGKAIKGATPTAGGANLRAIAT